jgi:hypothetical protein
VAWQFKCNPTQPCGVLIPSNTHEEKNGSTQNTEFYKLAKFEETKSAMWQMVLKQPQP